MVVPLPGVGQAGRLAVPFLLVQKDSLLFTPLPSYRTGFPRAPLG